MEFNLNQPNALSVEKVRALLASGNDAEDRQLRVHNSGRVYLSPEVGAENIAEVLFRFPTWDAGSGYVGPEAAKDQAWVDRIFNALRANWPNPKSRYIDSF